ncbi:MAG: peptidoglycan DD-metalloendopeptidase family protein [Gammaproteobacteria bacterium]|nr:peptidoglycan DD-metalloendopeptidase family protein [Gammaproteobacteria bacterium]
MIVLSLLTACTSKGVAPVYNRVEPASPAQKVTRPGYYKVKSGDTLYSIAWRYRVNYRSLAAWNRIKGPHYRIYAGQWLRLHPHEKPQKPASVKEAKTTPTVTVKRSPSHQVVTAPTPDPKVNKSKTDRAASLKLNWLWPTKGNVIQTFSMHDPSRRGVKIRGVSGQSVVAAESGKVVYSGSGLVGYGNLIIIKHNKNYLSAYGYNKKLLVKEGDKVLKGERIAQMGSPRNGTDPALHFEIRKQGKPIDPLSLFNKK